MRILAIVLVLTQLVASTTLYATPIDKVAEEELTAEQAYNKGTGLYQAGKYTDAIPLLTKAIDLNPSYFAAFINRGNCYRYTAQYEKAVEDYNRAHEVAPKHTFPLINLGLVYNYLSRYDEAIEQYMAVLEIDSDSLAAQIGLIKAKIGLGEYQKAFNELNVLISEHPDNNNLHYTRGCLFMKIGDNERAIIEFTAAIKIERRDGLSFRLSLTNRGACYSQLGKFDKALKDYNEVVEKFPDYVYGLSNRANVLRYSDMKAALADMNKAVEISKEHPIMLAIRAEIYRNSGMFEEAIKDLEVALKASPKQIAWTFNMGMAHYQNKQSKEAITWFEKVIELNKDHTTAYYYIGHSNKQMKKYSDAIKWYKKSLELDKNFFYSHISLGECYGRKKKYDDASKEITIARDMIDTWRANAPKSNDPVYALACVNSVASLTHKKNRDGKKAAAADRKAALEYLVEAVEMGVWDYTHIETDEDLSAIRKEEAYIELVKKMKK